MTGPTSNDAPEPDPSLEGDADPESLSIQLVSALRGDRFDEAERLCEQLARVAMDDVVFSFKVLILIRRGRVLDALRAVHARGEGSFPELRAVCLNLLQDPYWHSIAESLVETGRPSIRGAMLKLLQRQG